MEGREFVKDDDGKGIWETSAHDAYVGQYPRLSELPVREPSSHHRAYMHHPRALNAPGNTAIVADVPIPEPGDNEIRISVHSVALNPIDPLYVANPQDAPGRVVGSDIAGTVEKVGKDVTQWSVGDRVAGFLQGATSVNPRPGGFAEFAILEADLAIRIPSAATFEEAATLPLCSLTAAQALFIRLGLHAPFPHTCAEAELGESPAILIYSAATSVGLLAVELARVARTASGKPYRIFATASEKHHQRLLDSGVDAVFDYRSPTWPEDVYKASGGISAALDCISEDESTMKISHTFGESGGTVAVLRQSAWHPEGHKDKVNVIYSAVWSGLGHEILYNGGTIPPSSSWRAFTVEFFKFLSAGSPTDASRFPIEPIPQRVMPGGLEAVVPDAFQLLGSGKVIERQHQGSEPWLQPISAEKLSVCYRTDDEGEIRLDTYSAPYGTWSSPITAEAITKGAISFADVIVDPITSTTYHIEARPSEEGRNTLINTKTGQELTPGKEWNVRTGVHEYGGAPAIVYNDFAFFSRFNDGRVYRVKEGREPEAVTPDSDKAHRFANFDVHPKHTHLLVSVLEDHTIDQPAAIVNSLCIINTNTKTVHPLVSGADFYASPKFSPDGTRLAWQQWFHPDMPWEGGQIHIGDIIIESDTVTVKNTVHIAGETKKISAAFPSWANNDTLIFTSDESGYINPWKYQNGKATALFPQPVEQEFGVPLWVLQFFPYAILDKAVKDGRSGLHIVDLTGVSAPQALDVPYVVINHIRSVSRETHEVVFTGEKVDEEASIIKCTIADLSSGSPTFTVLKPASVPPFSRDFVSTPQPMTFKAANGDPIHVVYYAPRTPDYSGSSIAGERPPCVLHVHGGPTGLTVQSLNWKVQYFTSRGWAWQVLDVNYGGSSGYGRDYIQRLVGNWGVVDVEDCIQAARIISSAPYNLVDPKRVVIRGGSAGGYTVLAALANAPDVTAFAAGTSSYGVSDLNPLVEHTHKFESRYLEKLVGGTSKEVPEVYKDRSPLNHADRIVAPLLVRQFLYLQFLRRVVLICGKILQGEIDRVVPKEQAELIYDGVKSRGGIIEYKLYLGEGHGWRQEKNIRDALERELQFYEGVLGLKN
ncbi:hypothetical protein D9615_008213 [Tricholomella constricta]|uniref:Enoyl reductase (ER) domain-containing protein n=1 Tax=Tricholomella constricta TaxID=117010 RepID=A0A8H5H3D5_9AGAR|nr:hypothetical protein D9615_008213 [Tricholomella constricta]